MNPNQPQNNQPAIKTLAVAQYSSGPIPEPETLAAYEKIHPGLADRIMKMAESQSTHRKEIERTVIIHDTTKSMRGLNFAFFIVLVAITAGTYITIKGQPTAGVIVSAFSLSTIVGAFIYQERGNRKGK